MDDNKQDLNETIESEEVILPETEEDFIPDGHERISELESKVNELEEALEAEKNSKLRALADYQNLKNRFEKERHELINFSQTLLLTKLLDIIDDFSNSLKTFTEENSDAWKKGIEMLYEKFLSLITSQGVEVIEVNIGDVFDPQIHEAISFVNTQTDEENQKVAHIVSLGFRKIEGGQVIKTAKVIVNKKQ